MTTSTKRIIGLASAAILTTVFSATCYADAMLSTGGMPANYKRWK